MSLYTLISSQASRAVAALFGIVFTAVAAAPARAQTPVVFGDVITDPGIYFLAGNQSGTGHGIEIASDDVVLLLTRFTLRGDGSGVGISSEMYDNVHILGGRVTNFSTGVSMGHGQDCSVEGTRIDHCDLDGLSVLDLSGSLFSRVRCDYNSNGVLAEGVFDSRFVSVLAHDNDVTGIVLSSSEFNKVRLCWAAYNGRDGIRLRQSNENEIQRNECVGNDEAGIHLAPDFGASLVGAEDGSHSNRVKSNWCVFNDDGIRVEENSASNTLTNNTALANFGHDMVDGNNEPPCENTWFLNFFLTKDGDGEDCIF